MTIKLEKETKLTGKVFYNLYADTSFVDCFLESEHEKALDAYNNLIDRVKKGIAKIEVVRCENVETPQP